jgi:hypothetical protein
MGGFLDPKFILGLGPSQFPRQVERLLWHIEFTDVVNIGGPGDSGGNLLGTHNGLGWVLQCKWKRQDKAIRDELVRSER